MQNSVTAPLLLRLINVNSPEKTANITFIYTAIPEKMIAPKDKL